VKQTTQTVARVVESPAELEPVSTGYIGEDANGRGEDDGAEWLWLLWERRRFLWQVTVRGLIVATIIAFLIPKRYESTTRLMPPDQRSGSGAAMLAALVGRGMSSGGAGGAGGLGSIASDLLGGKTSGALFADILRGRTVQDRLIGRFDLRKVYWDRYWEDARKDLTKYTDITEDRKSGVITIAVTDRDRHRAESMAEAYIEELDRLVAQVSTSSARRERIFLEQRLKDVRRDLEIASQQFSEYASKNTLVDVTSQTKAMVEGAARLQGELIVAQSELEGLEQIYTVNNVRVRSLRARVAELKNQLDKLGGNSAPVSANEPNSGPDSSPEQLYPSIRKLPLLGVRWLDLYRETKIQETVYELLTQEYEMAKIEEAKEIPVVKVLDAANVPERKSSPHRSYVMLVGGMFFFFAAVTWVVGERLWGQVEPDNRSKLLVQAMCSWAKELKPVRWLNTRGDKLALKLMRSRQ